ncbi:MAG: glycosyltransferase [Methyloprofundus sp.]|nr:glycosyltransferase [Methyloprofundus sp.]
MKIAVDASNIRKGGGITHLVNLFKYLDIDKVDIDEIVLFSGLETLSAIADKPWLIKINHSFLEKNLFWRVLWRHYKLPEMLVKYKCDVLFSPGSITVKTELPIITISQNMLPFDKIEKQRYSIGRRLRYSLLKIIQTRSFNQSNGVIFLTHAHLDKVENEIGKIKARTIIIPHGVEASFFQTTRHKDQSIDDSKHVFKWLYVSYVKPYKHQWNVVRAIMSLRNKGVNVKLDLVGPAYLPSLNHLKAVMQECDPGSSFITYHGPKYGEELRNSLNQADGFVFASSCETFGQVLIEAMASGLPIASSNIAVAQEVAQDCAEYFDPENTQDIANAMNTIIQNAARRQQSASRAREIASVYSPEYSANTTFKFIVEVAKESAR